MLKTLLLVGAILLWVPLAQADVHLKYHIDTLSIVAMNTSRPYVGGLGQVGYANLTVSGSNAVTWPVPSDGCSSGTRGWSRVNQHPNPTTVVLKEDLKIFRCQEVYSVTDVDAIVDRESKALCDSFPQPDPLVQQLKLDVDRVCEGDTADSGDCADARTAYTAVVTARARNAAADKAAAKRLTEAIQALHTEAATFKTAQGW